MSAPTPHFLLYSASAPVEPSGTPGDWRFVLEAIDGSAKIEVADSEPEIRGERLELLAVVRGLEALEQPSHVTLVTPSRYVSRGISYGLNDWRENDWQWERHGEMVPVKNHDLWQRIDRALEFHRVECRQWRLDSAHEQGGAHHNHRPLGEPCASGAGSNKSAPIAARPRSHRAGPRLLAWRRTAGAFFEKVWLRIRQMGAPLFRAPWLD